MRIPRICSSVTAVGRGLDILNKIQKELDVRYLIYEGDLEDREVDSKLVKLAKVLHGKVRHQ